jgi:hypothetical protein
MGTTTMNVFYDTYHLPALAGTRRLSRTGKDSRSTLDCPTQPLIKEVKIVSSRKKGGKGYKH